MSIQKLIIGAFVSIAEEGQEIDSITVSNLARPDTDPSTNYTELGCIQGVDFDMDVEEDEDFCPNESGFGYTKETDKNIVSDYMIFSLRDHSEQVFRLLFGKEGGAIVDGTAFTPFEDTRREIRCWLHLQAKSNGNTNIDMFQYGKLTLEEYPGWSKDYTKPQLKFQRLSSPLNEITPSAISDPNAEPAAPVGG